MSVTRGVFATLFLSLVLFGCSPKSSDIIVLEVGPTKVSMREYEDFFTRNSGGWDAARKSTQEERERFLDLLTNYKLKLLDAYDRNLLNDEDIVRELKEYRASLASTFMIEKELNDPGTRNIYERRKEEIRAQHILLSVKPDASPEDTARLYAKAMGLIHRAKSGENFDTLAVQFSDDPSAKTGGGDIYYFTSGQMVSAFEDAAYAMHTGEISSKPVRSPFGYHILKINDRQPVRGTIKVRHIMTRFQSPNPDSADAAGALARIKGLQDSLKKGWDFSKLAIKLSEDGGSAPQGGDLSWFERRRWVLPFDDAAFKLKVGEVSSIVRTPYGYHILKCDSSKPPPSFDEMKEDLKKLYQQHKYTEDYAEYIGKIKKDVQYSFNEDVFDEFSAQLDSAKSVGDSAWDASVSRVVRARTLMSINGKQILVDTILAVLEHRPEYKSASLRKKELRARVDRISDSFLLEEKSAGLEQRYPEFGALMKEYDDGVVLYKAEQLEVWNKASVSDSALKNYYEENKTKFMFSERVNISEIDLESDTLAALIYDSLSHGADFSAMASRHNTDEELKTKGGARGMLAVDADDISKLSVGVAVGKISEPSELENGAFVIIKVNAREPARQKTFEEAGAEVSNMYQDTQSKLFEKRWLDRVKVKYPVKQYKEVLPKAFNASH
jgi:peptidyl-prolyl cis-trans isomerase SurA